MEFLIGKLKEFENNLNYKKALVIIAVISLVVYANTLINGMFWDDYDSVINNQYIRSWENFPKYFSENLTAGTGIRDNYWRPLLLFSFSVDYKIGGLESFFYHLQNLFWHILSGMLVFLLINKLLKNNLAGLIGSILFLVHPLQTEAVSYVAGRADPMHLALMLGSLLLFIAYSEKSDNRKYFLYSLMLFVLALLAKERAIVFPGFILLYLMTFYGGKIIGNWKRKIILLTPYILIAGLYLILRSTVFHFTDTFDLGASNNIGVESFLEKILVYLKALAIYAGLIVWPARLYMEKTISVPHSFWDSYVICGAALFITSIFISWRSWKKRKIAAFGLIWFFGAILPSLHVFPIQGLLYEHWLYPAFPGLFLLVGYFFSYLIGKKQTNRSLRLISIIVLISIIFALGVRTMIRNADWENPIKFYEKNISLGGKSARVMTNLGMAYDEKKDHEKAITAYQEAILLDNRLFQPWHNTGVTLAEQHKFNEALNAYQKASEINPNFLPSLINSGIIYFNEGKKDEAKRFFKRALEIDPNNQELIKIFKNL